MAEFLCDTMPDTAHGGHVVDRHWTDLPRSRSSSARSLYIPRPADDRPMRPSERSQISEYGIRNLLHMVSISREMEPTDQELRGLLHCRQYLDHQRDSWWGAGRYNNDDI